MASRRISIEFLGNDAGASKTAQKVAGKIQRQMAKVDGMDVDIDVDVDQGLRSIGTFADSSSSILSGAFKIISANALVMGAAVAAALGGLPVIAALAATGIVLGFGGALATIGIIAAAQSKKVRNAFTDLKDHVVGTVKEISAPFESTLVTIADVAKETFDAFVPALRDSFALMAPAISDFVEFAGEAFEKLAPAVKPLTDAFVAILDQLGPQLPGLFASISGALVELAGVVEENADEFSAFIILILGGIPLAVKAVAGLANVFGRISSSLRTSSNESGSVLNELGKTIRTFTAAARKIWDQWGDEITAIARFVWSGISRQIKTALRIIRGVINFITGIITGDWQQAWNGIKQILSAVWDFIKSLVKDRIDRVKAIIRGAWNAVKSFTKGAWNAVFGFFKGIWKKILDFFLDVVEKVLEGADKMLGWVPGVGDKLGDALDAFRRWRDGVTDEMGLTRKKVNKNIGAILDRFGNMIGPAGRAGERGGRSFGRGLGLGVRGKFRDVRGIVGNIVDFFRGLADRLRPQGERAGSALGRGLAIGIGSQRSSILGTVSGIVGDIIRSFGSLGSLGAGINLGFRPMAEGGIVRARPGGTLALLGEAGQDEAVIPLDRPGMGGTRSSEPEFVGVVQLVLDGKVVQESLLRLKRRNGGLALGIA